jgi:hypothetical protein
MAGVWRYRDDGDGLGNGGVQGYWGSGDGRSDQEYILGKPLAALIEIVDICRAKSQMSPDTS